MIWLLAVLGSILAAGTVWFLARPLALATGGGAQIEAREQYYQLLNVRDRLLVQLNEIDLDAGDRSMDAGTAADERARLEGELAAVLEKLDALASDETAQTAEQKQAHARSTQTWRKAIIVLAVVVPGVAISLYLVNVTVAPTDIEEAAALPAGVPPQALKMVERLAQRLREHPDDLSGWLKLGRSYAVLGRLEDATLAYEQAYRLLPKNFEPDSPEAYWFLGLAAYRHGETAQALAFWRKLLAAMPPDSDAAKQLKAVIEHARSGGKQK